MEAILQDLRQALRRLLKTPEFTALAVATLALAIGSQVAIFSLIEALFLRPLPVRAPQGLVGVYETRDGTGAFPMSYPDVLDAWRCGRTRCSRQDEASWRYRGPTIVMAAEAVLLAAAAVLAGVTGLASWWPARQASRIDPIVALRRP